MPNISKKEIKETMSKYENRQTSRFKAFQILSNNVEEVVQSTSNMWNTFFYLNKAEETKEVKATTDSEMLAAIVIASLPTSSSKALASLSSKSIQVTPELQTTGLNIVQPSSEEKEGKGKGITPSLSSKVKGKGKIIDDIDLDEEIAIPNLDLSNLSADRWR
jgi:hypothetical protein